MLVNVIAFAVLVYSLYKVYTNETGEKLLIFMCVSLPIILFLCGVHFSDVDSDWDYT